VKVLKAEIQQPARACNNKMKTKTLNLMMFISRTFFALVRKNFLHSREFAGVLSAFYWR